MHLRRRTSFAIALVAAIVISDAIMWKDFSVLWTAYFVDSEEDGLVQHEKKNDGLNSGMLDSSQKQIVHQLKEELSRMNASFFETRSRELQKERDERDEQHKKLQSLQLQLQRLTDQQQQQQQQQQSLQQQILPQCDELMQRPNSPLRDGAFLTSHKTPIRWTLRADGSRQFDLDNFCRLKRYTAAEARQCLASTHISFIGDSLTRYQYLSLAYFLEHDTFPPRFGNYRQPCVHIDESGQESCSPVGQPNICIENDWVQDMPAEFHWDSWLHFFTNLAGGEDGGIMKGRMECKFARAYSMNCGPGCSVENELYTNGQSQTMMSYFSEFGWDDNPVPLHGFSFTNCSQLGTCRQTYEQSMHFVNRSMSFDFDWNQSFPEAIDKDGVLRQVLPRNPDIAIYNRGLWGQISGARAQSIMPLMYDWVNSNKTGGRCFFKSTTANDRSINANFWDKELHQVRPHAYEAGCEYLDYAYLTDTFSAIHPKKDWHFDTAGERMSIFIDMVHYQPWVYEELNQVLLNVLCNSKKFSADAPQ